jgi:hypothetical protein
MAIVPLPLPPHAEARALLHHILEQGDVVRRDCAGRTILQLAVDDWMLDRLMAFDADATELEDADTEPEPDEVDSCPVLQFDLVPPKQMKQPRRSRCRASRVERRK